MSNGGLKTYLGASSACFYPLETERALDHVLQLGFRNTEIFFNAACELKPAFVKQLRQAADQREVCVRAIHPFTSFAETFCLFSQYRRRFTDMLEFYKRYFEASMLLNAPILVIHGSRLPNVISEEEYIERFGLLVQEGKKAGVTVAQENVVHFLSQDISFLKKMKDSLHDEFHMVLDIKQAVRAGYDPLIFAQQMRDSICHIHISDHDVKLDCVPPGRGDFDFAALKRLMDAGGYQGNYMIEFYQEHYDVDAELKFSKSYMESIIL